MSLCVNNTYLISDRYILFYVDETYCNQAFRDGHLNYLYISVLSIVIMNILIICICVYTHTHTLALLSDYFHRRSSWELKLSGQGVVCWGSKGGWKVKEDFKTTRNSSQFTEIQPKIIQTFTKVLGTTEIIFPLSSVLFMWLELAFNKLKNKVMVCGQKQRTKRIFLFMNIYRCHPVNFCILVCG